MASDPALPGPFHDGEKAVQARAGVSAQAGRVGRGIRDHVPGAAKPFLERARLLFLGAVDAEGRVWASALDGPPGFARAVDDHSLWIGTRPVEADPIGAALTADPIGAALTEGAEVGMLIIDFGTRERMRVNGRIETRAGDGLLVRASQVYSNCPKYIQRRDLDFARHRESADEAGSGSRTESLSSLHQRLVGSADTFLIASVAPGHGVDVSHRGGAPGFVRAEGGRRIVWPDYSGNMMFNTLGNLTVDGRAGLLFPDFRSGGLLHVSGRGAVLWDDPRRAEFAGAERLVELTVERVVFRPGALSARATGVEASPFNP